MPAKMARSAPRPPSGLPEVTVAVRIALLPCREPGKPRISKPVPGSSGESRLIIPDEAKANSAAMSAWIDSNRGTKRRKRGRKTVYKPRGSIAPQSTAPTKRSSRNRPVAQD